MNFGGQHCNSKRLQSSVLPAPQPSHARHPRVTPQNRLTPVAPQLPRRPLKQLPRRRVQRSQRRGAAPALLQPEGGELLRLGEGDGGEGSGDARDQLVGPWGVGWGLGFGFGFGVWGSGVGFGLGTCSFTAELHRVP